MLTQHPKAIGPSPKAFGYGRSPFPYDLQTAMFGEPCKIMPHTPLGTIALGVASHYCDECDDDVTPTVSIETQYDGTVVAHWNPYPCHLSECGCCYSFGILCDNCGNVEDCCGCVVCPHCDEKFDDGDLCSSCGYCDNACCCYSCDSCGTKLGEYADYWTEREDGEPICESCYYRRQDDNRRNLVMPGWVLRKWETDANIEFDAERTFRKKYAKVIDPAQSMCNFYLTDYVMAVLPTEDNHCTWHGTWADEDGNYSGVWTSTYYGHDSYGPSHTVQLRRDARTLQRAIVVQCDEAFRHYAFMAIGGEVRHHRNVSAHTPSHGRNNTWAWWAQMGQKYGRTELLADATELFRDTNAWPGSGYGGEKWAVACEILLARESGQMDAKTFVDRMFSLQHNGGSFLNKVDWVANEYSVHSMQSIGNAHASDVVDFYTLMYGASEDVRSMIASVVPYMADGLDKESAESAVRRLIPTDDEDAATDAASYACTCDSCKSAIAESYGTTQHNGDGPYCKNYGPEGYYCTGAPGHGGLHKAYFGTDNPCNTPEWM